MHYAYAAVAGFSAFVAGYTYSVSENENAARWWVPVLCGVIAAINLVKLVRRASPPISN